MLELRPGGRAGAARWKQGERGRRGARLVVCVGDMYLYGSGRRAFRVCETAQQILARRVQRLRVGLHDER